MFKLGIREVHRQRARRIFNRWVRGHSFEVIAADEKVTKEQAHRIVVLHLRECWRSWYKWRLAETRCHALAMELRLLRIGKEAPPDQLRPGMILTLPTLAGSRSHLQFCPPGGQAGLIAAAPG
jgi:hypothetical protein